MTDDTRSYDIGTIYDLLVAAFTPGEMRRFLRVRPLFRPVLDGFGPGYGLDDMVEGVIEYCETRLLWDELLAEVKEVNPHQYARFRQKLYAKELDATFQFDWVTIPAGDFTMGSDKKRDPLASSDEEEQRLFLPEYKIARIPVTVLQFRHYVTTSHPLTTAQRQGYAHDLDPTHPRRWPKKDGAYWARPHGPDSRAEADHPVTCVSWNDANAFCVWANVRLPTEAEWEKAARGTDARIYPWGDERPDRSRCNFRGNVGDTTPVPTLHDPKPPRYPAGANGLFDMAGNVWEWTSSLYRASRYHAEDGRENPEVAGDRVLRGGSFYQDDRNVRCANRHYHVPNATVSDIGFRVCAL